MNINGYAEESLLDTNTNEETAQVFPTSKMRWWVLLWYSYISALQSLIWMTFSSVPDVRMSFYFFIFAGIRVHNYYVTSW
jgi:hypothetical protein